MFFHNILEIEIKFLYPSFCGGFMYISVKIRCLCINKNDIKELYRLAAKPFFGVFI